MQVRALGPGAPDVPVIGFGAMPLSIPNRPPEPVGLAVLHASLDAGVRLIDTAGVYCLGEHELGHNERLVAEALRTWHGPRDEVVPLGVGLPDSVGHGLGFLMLHNVGPGAASRHRGRAQHGPGRRP